MTIITGQSITAPATGTLKLKGQYYAWPGYCGGYANRYTTADIDLGTVAAGQTYSIVNKGHHTTCPIYGAEGQGVVLQVINTGFNDPTDGAAFQWPPVAGTAYYLELNYQSAAYDCINGNCVVNTQYNTPGLYQSLTDCQAVCANGGACGAGKQCVDPTIFCPPGKVCIEQSEINDINNLLTKIQSEACH